MPCIAAATQNMGGARCWRASRLQALNGVRTWHYPGGHAGRIGICGCRCTLQTAVGADAERSGVLAEVSCAARSPPHHRHGVTIAINADGAAGRQVGAHTLVPPPLAALPLAPSSAVSTWVRFG